MKWAKVTSLVSGAGKSGPAYIQRSSVLFLDNPFYPLFVVLGVLRNLLG